MSIKVSEAARAAYDSLPDDERVQIGLLALLLKDIHVAIKRLHPHGAFVHELLSSNIKIVNNKAIPDKDKTLIVLDLASSLMGVSISVLSEFAVSGRAEEPFVWTKQPHGS